MQQAFLVFKGAKGGRVHALVGYMRIKELAESVRKYGTNANFTLVQLDRLAGMALTPADWQMIVKAAPPVWVNIWNGELYGKRLHKRRPEQTLLL